jgi:hypothetical protein
VRIEFIALPPTAVRCACGVFSSPCVTATDVAALDAAGTGVAALDAAATGV